MHIDRIPEWQLTHADDKAIADLLSRCFETDFGGRSYFAQRHHLRLITRHNGQIVGHMALLFRHVRLGDTTFEIVGLAEVATDPAHRAQGIAAALLQTAIATARTTMARHFLLFGTAKLYTAAGFQSVDNPVRYVENHNNCTGKVLQEQGQSLMVLPLNGDWDKTATLDLIGGRF